LKKLFSLMINMNNSFTDKILEKTHFSSNDVEVIPIGVMLPQMCKLFTNYDPKDSKFLDTLLLLPPVKISESDIENDVFGYPSLSKDSKIKYDMSIFKYYNTDQKVHENIKQFTVISYNETNHWRNILDYFILRFCLNNQFLIKYIKNPLPTIKEDFLSLKNAIKTFSEISELHDLFIPADLV